MPGTFIISFDCEGKWGVADHLDARTEELFTTERLAAGYRQLLSLLAEHRLRATFAFVGAYMLPNADAYADLLAHDYARAFRERRSDDGWFNPEAVRLVREGGGHEIAAHGFTHRPFPAMTAAEAERELAALAALDEFRGRDWTLVYPRNLVAHADALPRHRAIAYRAARRGRGTLDRVLSLAEELWVWGRAERGGLPIPAGYLLNWRHGARALVPPRVTIARWRRLLDDAAKREAVIHLWSHPHNFLTGSGMFPMFGEILSLAAEHCRRGTLVSRTQLDYAAAAR